MDCTYIALCFLVGAAGVQAEGDEEYPDYGEEPCAAQINVTETSGIIKSTNYPELPHLDLQNCTWTIISPSGTRIGVKFSLLFELEADEHGNCMDFLSIADSTITRKLCGTDTPKSFLSISDQLLVNFFSNELVEGAGFSMNWIAIDISSIPTATVTNITSNEGRITSPGFPNDYTNFLEHTWNIRVDAEKYIFAEFDSFGMESGRDASCPYDALTVASGTPTKITEFCTKPSGPILFKTNALKLTFTSDSTITGSGFSLVYRAVDPVDCSSPIFINGSKGVISSPYYPAAYEDNLNCTWHVIAPLRMRIAVRFNGIFHIKSQDSCTTDVLQLFDGSSKLSKQIFEDFCRENPPRGFLSSTNHLTVSFRSGSLPGDAVGFLLNWTAEVQCQDQEFQCWDGTCVNVSKKCDGKVDCLNDIADEAECGGTSSENGCGNQQIPPDFFLEHRIVGGTEAKKGSWPWMAGLLSSGSIVCGGVLVSSSWVLTAAHCFQKGVSHSVILGDYNRTDYNTTEEQVISVDQIYIHPKYNHQSPQGYLNGSDIALFHLTNPVQRTTWVQPICLPTSGPVVGQSAVVIGWGRTSATYTGRSEVLRQVRLSVLSEHQCEKTFSTLSSAPLVDGVICMAVDGAAMGACQGDSGGPAMGLRNGTWEVIGLISFSHQCGVGGLPTYFTDVASYISYIQKYLQDGPPERLERFTIISDENGNLSFPAKEDESYPKYPQNVLYRWFITVSEGKRITVRFGDSFNIEFGGEFCPYDYLKVYDGPNLASTPYLNRRLCGNFAPPNFESTSNAIVIEFSSDNSYEEDGFSLSWSTGDDCLPNEFRCWNKTCVKASQKCDGRFDCHDGSDEILCQLASTGSRECGKAEVEPVVPWYPLIVGGHDATEGSWPWQVALFEEESGNFVCGASLIDSRYVLTAAHCVESAKNYTVTVGDHDFAYVSQHEKRVSVKSKLKHQRFSIVGSYDLALLELSEEVEYSRWIKPLCLPRPNDVNPVPGYTCILTGWGITASQLGLPGPQVLQQVPLTIMSDEDCLSSYKMVQPNYPFTTLPPNLICAGHEHKRANACLRDSGGPLQCLVEGSWRLYGTVSFGLTCGDHIFFERVSTYIDWIEENIPHEEFCNELIVREGTSGVVQVPVVNGRYPSNLNCSWLLRATENKILEIEFEYFDVEEYLRCEFDYAVIYDGNNKNARKYLDEILCGKERSLPSFESSTNEVLITFRSDESASFRGFKLSWTAVDDCAPNEFRCWDGTCIEASRRCDGIMNCPKNRDEIECPHSTSTCGRQYVAPEFLWSARIIGGSFAVKGSWPWQAYILDGSQTFKCGASIIHKDWILTAAHCTFLGTLFVGIGGHDLSNRSNDQIIKVVQFTRHENYSNPEINAGYDIALLKLEKSISFGAYEQPVCLATVGDVEPISTSSVCVVTGWGYTRSNGLTSQILRQVRLPIINNEQCRKANGAPFDPDLLFCAGSFDNGGYDSCEGDSGGPMVCFERNNWFLYGIVSYGTDGANCGRPGNAGFYTKVSYYEEWIRKVSNISLPTTPSSVPTGETSTTNVANSSVPTSPSSVPTRETTMATTTDSTTSNFTAVTHYTTPQETTNGAPTIKDSTTSQETTSGAPTMKYRIRFLLNLVVVISELCLVVNLC